MSKRLVEIGFDQEIPKDAVFITTKKVADGYNYEYSKGFLMSYTHMIPKYKTVYIYEIEEKENE